MALWCGKHQKSSTGNLCQQPQKVQHYTYLRIAINYCTIINSTNTSSWQWQDVIAIMDQINQVSYIHGCLSTHASYPTSYVPALQAEFRKVRKLFFQRIYEIREIYGELAIIKVRWFIRRSCQALLSLLNDWYVTLMCGHLWLDELYNRCSRRHWAVYSSTIFSIRVVNLKHGRTFWISFWMLNYVQDS